MKRMAMVFIYILVSFMLGIGAGASMATAWAIVIGFPAAAYVLKVFKCGEMPARGLLPFVSIKLAWGAAMIMTMYLFVDIMEQNELVVLIVSQAAVRLLGGDGGRSLSIKKRHKPQDDNRNAIAISENGLDICDERWRKIRHLFPPDEIDVFGRIIEPSNRNVFSGAMWIARTGAEWDDLPRYYGSKQEVYSRFEQWRDSGLLEAVFIEFSKSCDE